MPARRSMAAVALAAGLLLLATGCDAEGEPQAGPSPTAEPRPADPAGEPVLEDGVHFGLIRAVANPGATEASITFDPAELFLDDAATIAAIEDGVISEGEDLADEHYIRNPEREFATYPLIEGAEILAIDQDDCCEPVPVDLATFARAFATEREDQSFIGPEAGYQVTIQDGHVQRIEEVYLP